VTMVDKVSVGIGGQISKRLKLRTGTEI